MAQTIISRTPSPRPSKTVCKSITCFSCILFVSVFGMLLTIWVLIAADGIVAPAAVHAGSRPHQPCVEQLHGCVVHIAQGGHDICKAVPDGKLRRRTRCKFIINIPPISHIRHRSMGTRLSEQRFSAPSSRSALGSAGIPRSSICCGEESPPAS